MTPSDPVGAQGEKNWRARRATVDDVPKLSELWQSAKLSSADLEKRFTDFQVIEDEKGKIIAAIGLHIVAYNARVHSEAFIDSAQKDTLRPALWARLQTVAQNHGLFRLWTEEADPWWKETAGFDAPTAEVLQKLPEAYGTPHEAWRTLRLKDEAADPDYLDKQFAMFKEASRADLDKLMSRGRAIKIAGTIIAAVVLAMALILMFMVVKHRRR